MSYAYQGAAMSLFFGGPKKEVILFSPIEGTLTFQGTPLANAKIKLHLTWKDQKGETFYYSTNEDGSFKIPQHKSEFKESPLAQLVIRQELTVEHNGNHYEVWIMSKMDPAEFTEFGGEPVGLVCEITNDLTTVRGINSLGGVSCSWKSLKVNGDN